MYWWFIDDKPKCDGWQMKNLKNKKIVCVCVYMYTHVRIIYIYVCIDTYRDTHTHIYRHSKGYKDDIPSCCQMFVICCQKFLHTYLFFVSSYFAFI